VLLIEAEDHHEAFNDSPVELFLINNQNFTDVKGLFGYFSLDVLQDVRGAEIIRQNFNIVRDIHLVVGSVKVHCICTG